MISAEISKTTAEPARKRVDFIRRFPSARLFCG
jgi:hypothetical protein